MNNNYSRSYEYRLVIFLFLTWGFVFLDRTTLGYLMPVMVHDLHLTNTQVGQVNMWQTIGYAISAPLIGTISDRTGYRKRFLVLAVLSTAVFSALSAVTNSFGLLLVVRFLVGASEGPILPLAVLMMASASSQGKFGRNVGIINAGVSVIANMVGPTFVTQLVSHTNWHSSFLIVSIPSIFLALILWKFTKEVPKNENQTTRETEKNWSGIFEVLKYRNVVVGIFLSIFCMSSLWILYSFGPLYLTNVGKLSVEKMGFSMSAMGIVGILWTIMIPLISDHVGRRMAMIVFSILAILTPLCLYLFPAGGMGVTALIIFGSVIGSLPPIFMNIIPMESVPANLTATASALIMGVGEIAGSLVLGLSGSLADSYGLHVVMILGTVAPLLMALFAFLLMESNPRKVKFEAPQALDLEQN